MLETTEDKIGLGLLVIGFVILAVFGITQAGAIAAVLLLGIYLVYAVVSVVLGVAAAFATAYLMGASFGLVTSAILKLAGIIVFTSAIAVAVPYGGLLGLVAYILLLMWMFELEIMELVVFTIVLWIMRFVVGLLLVAIIAAAGAAVR
jgi:hypothetical protein